MTNTAFVEAKKIVAILLLTSALSCRAELAYPGAPPGPARSSVRSQSIALTTDTLSPAWKVDETGLSWQSVRAGTPDNTLRLTGDVFRVVLTNGTSLRSSRLRPLGPPVERKLKPEPNASRLAGRLGGWEVELPLGTREGLELRWRAVLHDGANYVRQELEITAAADHVALQEIVWLDQPLADAKAAGRVDGSPLVAGNYFLGCEDPMARNEVVAGPEARALCRLPRQMTLRAGERIAHSFVIGVAPPGQMRRGFLYYLERERAHPYRPFLHYNSWYDISWQGFFMNETNCLEAIRCFGENLLKPHGVRMDSMVFDDGWDDPQSLWQFHAGFPNGFAPHAELCRQYNTRVGVWLSPFGGYGKAREQRLKYGREQGYETNPAGFSLAGPKYYAAFKDACVRMMRQYGVNFFKFDGIASGAYANGAGAQYIRDTEAMRRLMLELRQVDPNVYISLTTGSWPSPFWLRFADSVWRQAGDMGFAGKGNRQQQWLTYRDQEVFRNIVGKGPLYPLNALMTQGVAWSRFGSAAEKDFNSRGFQDDVRAFFGAGTSLQELYVQPQRLSAKDWSVLAEAAKWSRARAEALVDTHWIGGNPAKLEVYGYASWAPRQGLVMLRNPDDQPREFLLDIGAAFELPPGAPAQYTLKSPWAEDAGKAPLAAEAGQALKLTLQPFEVLILETAK